MKMRKCCQNVYFGFVLEKESGFRTQNVTRKELTPPPLIRDYLHW